MNVFELKREELKALQDKLKTMTPVDIAQYFEEMDIDEQALAASLLDKATLAEVFAEFDTEKKYEIISQMTQPEMTNLLLELDSDDLVDAMQELPSNIVTKMLQVIEPNRRQQINKLLNYPQESVGSLMSVDFVVVHQGDDRASILRKIRQSNAGYEHLTAVYVLDQTRKLIGYIYLADLIRLEDDNIEDVINYDIISVQTLTDQEEAANLINRYHFLALPVTDLEGRLVGIITADDILDIIADEIHEDYSLMQGVQVSNLDYLNQTPWQLAKQRVFWLLFLMVSATFTGNIIQAYDKVLSASVILAAYIPMLMDSGGNSGSQSSTVVIRALALDEITVHDFFKVMVKEAGVGLIVGAIIAVVNYFRIILFDGTNPFIAMTVSATLLCTIVISKLIGGLLPLLAKLAKQDPAVMASPLITTIVDAVALIIYFTIATNIMHLV
ncbi:magnesium transporter [Ignavigranum ruoffiae]|uniref:magnesium transporter n=1 Tax=Ignavigranum ruoffiae TaxID=89093 RepID=UPI002357A25F|nr:magnesium transporter [Ignavigranum ruoffiae]